MMIEMIITVMASLLSVVNPIGAVPVFLSLTTGHTSEENARTAYHTGLYFTILLIIFFLAGTFILSFFGISINAMRIAGGIVIFLSGFSLLQGQFEKGRAINKEIKEEAMEKEDISFAPMAMPILSGPGSISLLIGYFNEYPTFVERTTIVGVIILCGIIVILTLRTAQVMNRVLGKAGLKAISRIMGFIVMSIGIQYIITGVVALVNNLN